MWKILEGKNNRSASERISYADFFVSLKQGSLASNQENLIGMSEFRPLQE